MTSTKPTRGACRKGLALTDISEPRDMVHVPIKTYDLAIYAIICESDSLLLSSWKFKQSMMLMKD